MQEETKLTWKYFFEQKWEEIKPFFVVMGVSIAIIAIMIGGTFLTKWIVGEESRFCGNTFGEAGTCGMFEYTMMTLCAALVLFLVGLILLQLYEWLNENWRRARRRAREDLNNDKRRK